MKTCTKCKIEKSDDEFSFKNKKNNIRQSQCKICIKERDKQRYDDNIHNRKTKLRDQQIKNLIEVKKYYKKYKQSQKCSRCGDNRWYVIDFHHIKDKTMSVSLIVKKGSINQLKKELEKCIPLCANCHREIHYFEDTLEQS